MFVHRIGLDRDVLIPVTRHDQKKVRSRTTLPMLYGAKLGVLGYGYATKT